MHIAARPLLGCIADDFTGATDLANVLVRGGMRTVQSIGVPDQVDMLDADALVIALKSRTLPSHEAVAQSVEALRWLLAQGCRQFFFKYCSTFDSTEAGNIGPVADALLDVLNADKNSQNFTIACPAFPENGRAVYRGHLFVADALLNESGMENHPLTPMTDPNIVRVLQRQTNSEVGLLRYDIVAKGPVAARNALDALREAGVRIAISDALSDDDLLTLGAACADMLLITGGSGVAAGLPANFRASGLLGLNTAAGGLPHVEGNAVVLAGSASKATNAQVASWLETRPGYRIDPIALSRGEPVVDRAVAFARGHLDAAAPQPVLIYATATPDEVRAVQSELGTEAAGRLVEEALGSIAVRLRDAGFRQFVVAGGESSGAVVQALDVRMLRIGEQIDPGVPATISIATRPSEEPVALALKSGNFGTVDFFAKALAQFARNRP